MKKLSLLALHQVKNQSINNWLLMLPDNLKTRQLKLDLNDYEMPIYSTRGRKWHSTLATDFITNWNRRLTCNLFCRT
jgi:hypothetical protein